MLLYMYYLLIFLLDILILFLRYWSILSQWRKCCFCCFSCVWNFESMFHLFICFVHNSLSKMLIWFLFIRLNWRRNWKGRKRQHPKVHFIFVRSFVHSIKNWTRKKDIGKCNGFIEETYWETNSVTQHGLHIQFYFYAQLLMLFAEKITSTRCRYHDVYLPFLKKIRFVIYFHRELDTLNTLKKSGLLYIFNFSTNLYHLLFFSWHCDRREKLASLFSPHPPRHFQWDTYPSTKDAVPCILVILG